MTNIIKNSQSTSNVNSSVISIQALSATKLITYN